MNNKTGLINPSPKTNVTAILLSLLPYLSIPILGAFFYFRHDDSGMLLWAKEFTYPIYKAFSTNLDVNKFAEYPGMGRYWRPFTYLYVKMMLEVFGANPAPCFIFGGILFMAAVFFYFQIINHKYNTTVATLACYFLFIGFQGTMYNLFHLSVAISFFFQIGMIYCFWFYFKTGKWYYFLGMLAFLVPAMSRQTTVLLLVAILIMELVELFQKKERLQNPVKIIPALAGVIIVMFYIATFSSQTSHGSVLAVASDFSKTVAFLAERYFYYGTILTSGLTGLMVIFIISSGVVSHVLSRLFNEKKSFINKTWFVAIAGFVLTILFMKMQPNGIYWLTFCLLYLLLFDKELRMPAAWAGASLVIFLAVEFYHNGYLLEAAFPLSIVLGVLSYRIFKPVANSVRDFYNKHVNAAWIAGSSAIVLFAITFIFSDFRLPFLAERIDVVKISVDSNQNFKNLMNYMQNELPKSAVVYELSEEELGTDRFERRFMSLKDRAAIVKVMNLEDKQFMFRVLDRPDIKVLSPSGETELQGNSYFIALNNFERKKVESEYNLTLINEFRRTYDSAAIYRLNPRAASTSVN